MPIIQELLGEVSRKSVAWGCPAGFRTFSPRTTATKTLSGPRLLFSAPAKVARREWRSVGTHPDTEARWDASAGREARSTANTKAWKSHYRPFADRHFRPACPQVVTVVRTAT